MSCMKKRFLVLVLLLLVLPALAFAGTKTYSVAGVTFDNNDGSSRQQILREAYEKGGDFSKHPGSLKRYLYEGKGAIYVLLNGEIIGNIPKENVSELLPLIEKVNGMYVTVSRFRGDEGDWIYYAKATISSPQLTSSSTSNDESSLIPSHFTIPSNAVILFGSLFLIVVLLLIITLSRRIRKRDDNSEASSISFIVLVRMILLLLVRFVAFIAPVFPLVILDAPFFIFPLILPFLWFTRLNRYTNPVLYIWAFVVEIQRHSFDNLSVIFFVAFGMYCAAFFDAYIMPILLVDPDS